MLRRVFCKLLLVAVVVFGILALSGVLFAQGQGRSEEAFERVKEVQELHTERLMALKGVEGTAIGYNQNDRLAIKVFTDGPGVRGIPKELDGVSVQVVVTGKIYALADPTAKFERPVPTGVSTGHPDITAGTIGCRVTNGTDVYALSNNHVYANENDAGIGDNVLQPGAFDGGAAPADTIGTLDDFEPIVFGPRGSNTIDAAIAISTTDLLDNATPSDGYGTPSSTTVEATLDMAVQKYGRTTGLTQGEVTGVNGAFKVRYSSGFAIFVEQIVIEGIEGVEFSAGGDSGSLIVVDDSGADDDLKAVGLLFAGGGGQTIANPIDLVLGAFGVTIDDSEGSPPPENDPPTVSISSPADGSTFESGANIDFAGTATDTEDDDATLTAALAWTSSIDGPIGTGGSFSTTLSGGTHTITASVTDLGGETGSDSISITVGIPPTPLYLYVDVATDKSSYTIGERVYVTVTVTDDVGQVEGASVHTEITTASGKTYGADGTTASDGTAMFKFKIKKPDGIGTYTVTTDASKSGYDPGSGSTTFDAQ